MGLFSLLDTMLGSPMEKIMERLPISRKVKEALANQSGPMALFLKIAMAFERNQQKTIVSLIKELRISGTGRSITEAYMTSVKYANGLL